MSRQIYLFTTVDEMSAESIIRQLLMYDKESNEEITIFINSPGGSVTSFFAIYNVMQLIKSPIKTVVMGIAASASAILAACGKTRWMTEDSEFMLHEVWSFLMGSISEMSDKAERMRKMQERLLTILSEHTGKSEDQIKAAMGEKDKYFSAVESVSFGLADKVIKSSSAEVIKLSEAFNVEGRELAIIDGKPEVELLCEGVFSHPVYGELNITAQVLDQMKKNFDGNVRGIDISIDYTHDNGSGEKPAAFWIKSLEVVKNGNGSVLKAKGEFTPAGQKKVSEKEYKYASADFMLDYQNERGKHFPYVLCGGTLTNRPFIKELNPIKLSEHQYKQKEIREMNKEALINALREAGVDVMALQTELGSLKAEKEGLQNKIRELSNLPIEKDNEIKSLKTKLDELNSKMIEESKKKVFDSLMREGKVTPAQKDRIFLAFKTPEEMTEFYKDAPVLIKTAANGGDGDGTDEALTEDEQGVVNAGILSKEQVIAGRTIEKKEVAAKK